jgi:hypothetical protein
VADEPGTCRLLSLAAGADPGSTLPSDMFLECTLNRANTATDKHYTVKVGSYIDYAPTTRTFSAAAPFADGFDGVVNGQSYQLVVSLQRQEWTPVLSLAGKTLTVVDGSGGSVRGDRLVRPGTKLFTVRTALTGIDATSRFEITRPTTGAEGFPDYQNDGRLPARPGRGRADLASERRRHDRRPSAPDPDARREPTVQPGSRRRRGERGAGSRRQPAGAHRPDRDADSGRAVERRPRRRRLHLPRLGASETLAQVASGLAAWHRRDRRQHELPDGSRHGHLTAGSTSLVVKHATDRFYASLHIDRDPRDTPSRPQAGGDRQARRLPGRGRSGSSRSTASSTRTTSPSATTRR